MKTLIVVAGIFVSSMAFADGPCSPGSTSVSVDNFHVLIFRGCRGDGSISTISNSGQVITVDDVDADYLGIPNLQWSECVSDLYLKQGLNNAQQGAVKNATGTIDQHLGTLDDAKIALARVCQ